MKKKWYWAIGIFITAGLAFLLIPRFYKEVKAPTYRENVVARGDITVTILATGMVQPENRLEIKPPVAGRIDEVLVNEGDKVRKGQVLAWMSSAERSAMIDSARAEGPEEVKRWEDLYRPTPVVAPIAGMIILKNVENGQTFTSSDAVLVMSNRLTVKAQVDETDLARIKSGVLCEIRLDSYPEYKIDAKVDRIAYEAKTYSNVTTYTVSVVPKETPDFMRSGMTANVNCFVEDKRNILVIPTEYIKYDNGRPTTMARTEDGGLTERELKLGASDGKTTEILGGVSEGETIVLVIAPPKEKRGINPFSPMGNSSGGRRGGGR